MVETIIMGLSASSQLSVARLRVGGAAVGLLMTLALTAPAQPPGDIDGNGLVGTDDAEMLVEHLTGSSPLNSEQIIRAEANGQPGLDAGDVVWILTHRSRAPSGFVFVPAGTFEMGDPFGEGSSAERPVHSVTLSAFEIGRHEVTNTEYAAFLNSAIAAGDIVVTSGVVYLPGNSSDPLFDTYPLGSTYSQIVDGGGFFTVRSRDGHPMDDHPVVEVSWYGAAAHCNWLSRQRGFQEVYTEAGDWASDLSRNGYHLPTEAQWERAAAWDADQSRHWRYGFTHDSIDSTRANYSLGTDGYANPLNLVFPPYTSPVGHYIDSTSDVGCHDMSGNVWEWCNDWWQPFYTSDPVTDPEGRPSGTYRVRRGGAWTFGADLCRSASRVGTTPSSRFLEDGFRVSRNP